MDELTKIKERYDERKKYATTNNVSNFYFNWLIQKERELIYAKILRRYFGVNISHIKLMEIGAGTGDNIFFFRPQGH